VSDGGHLEWLGPALDLVDRGQSCVLVTVVQTRGSAPREVGAKMLVWSDGLAGTIGGGHLEFKAIVDAQIMMRNPDAVSARIERVSLGPQLAQCCGGSVELLFEKLPASASSWLRTWADMERAGTTCAVITDVGGESAVKTFVLRESSLCIGVPEAVAELARNLRFDRDRCALIESGHGKERRVIEMIWPSADHLYLFGAGHVGKAVVRALEPLPFRITWIDSRDSIFPQGLPSQVVALCLPAPPREVDKAPADAFFLVMSHSHALDLEICRSVLQRDDFAYLGLIGSETKRARFAGRLRAIGVSPNALSRMTCPIGLPGIAGKTPAAIAASVAAQLLIVAERRRAGREPSAAATGT
jgi:xanthine dehydrogenase accessory factor